MPVATPASTQAFTLDNYFNSSSTDPMEYPSPSNGLIAPANWGPGYKSWRREWRAAFPGRGGASPFWSPGLRKMIVKGSSPLGNGYFAADGNPFTINVWDLNISAATSAIIQVAAYSNSNGAQTFIDAPFASYNWGLYNGSSQITWPSRGSQNYVQITQPTTGNGSSIAINNGYQAGPNTQQHINVGALITFLFDSSIPTTNPVISLQIAVYLTLTPTAPSGPSVLCFDDPEMDVDTGSSDDEDMDL